MITEEDKMRPRSITGWFVAAALMTTPHAFAQAKAKKKPAKPAAKAMATPAPGMEMPKPAPEMAKLKLFDGNWSCTGSAPASPMGPAHKTQSTVIGHSGLGGFWQMGTVKEAKTAENPMAMEGMFHMTYDPANKQYVMVWVDSMGGWATSTSPGWEGDKIAWSGDGMMMGKKTPMHDTFVKKSDTELTHSFEAQMDGKWTPMG